MRNYIISKIERFNSYTFDVPIVTFEIKGILRILNVKCIHKAIISLKSV